MDKKTMTNAASAHFNRLYCTLLFVVSIGASSLAADKVTMQPAEGALPPPEVQSAFEMATKGKIGEAVDLLRSRATGSVRDSFYMGLLLVEWRKQLLLERSKSVPPIEWALDWLRCGTLSNDTSEINLASAIIAELYQTPYSEVKDKEGKAVQIPGPGQSNEIAECWTSVSDDERSTGDCIKAEQAWRKLKNMPAHELRCPPQEPTADNLNRFPKIKLN
jgi:hypothetical protein